MKRKMIFALGFILFFGFVSVNCNAQSSTNAQQIVGTWVSTMSDGKSETDVYNANGTGTETYDGKTRNFFWGVYPNGDIYISFESDGSKGSVKKIAISPDGKRMFYGEYGIMYIKK